MADVRTSYKPFEQKFSAQDGCLIWGTNVVIPSHENVKTYFGFIAPMQDTRLAINYNYYTRLHERDQPTTPIHLVVERLLWQQVYFLNFYLMERCFPTE